MKITNESDSILLHSSNFQELVNVATEAMKFKWDIKSNKDFMINDSTINFKKYIKWIKDNTEKLEKEKDK